MQFVLAFEGQSRLNIFRQGYKWRFFSRTAQIRVLMSRRPRRSHKAVFKAKAALAAIKGEKTLSELAEQCDVDASQAVYPVAPGSRLKARGWQRSVYYR